VPATVWQSQPLAGTLGAQHPGCLRYSFTVLAVRLSPFLDIRGAGRSSVGSTLAGQDARLAKSPSTSRAILCYAIRVKLLVLYRPNSEHATEVESYVRDFQRRYDIGRKFELVSLNTRDGAATASLYDIMSYPAILVLGDDGSMVSLWQGMPLPLMDDVAGYAHSASSH
jgi:hypothetical protein